MTLGHEKLELYRRSIDFDLDLDLAGCTTCF